MARRQEAPRGLASVGAVTLPQGFAGMGAFGLADAAKDADFRSSYRYFENYFGQASLGYLEGLQAMRNWYGIKGEIFSDPNPIQIPDFSLDDQFGYFGPGMWGGLGGGQAISDGNSGWLRDGKRKVLPGHAPGNPEVKRQVVRLPAKLPAKQPVTFGKAK